MVLTQQKSLHIVADAQQQQKAKGFVVVLSATGNQSGRLNLRNKLIVNSDSLKSFVLWRQPSDERAGDRSHDLFANQNHSGECLTRDDKLEHFIAFLKALFFILGT